MLKAFLFENMRKHGIRSWANTMASPAIAPSSISAKVQQVNRSSMTSSLSNADVMPNLGRLR